MTNTPMPAQSPQPSDTPLPSQTSTSTPSIIGTWSDAPSMLMPRSAHAVANSDSAIYALAGTDDHGQPVFEVEMFDGEQWRTVTRLPGEGLNAPTASIVEQKLYVIGGFLAVSNRPTDEVQVYDLGSRQWSQARPLPLFHAARWRVPLTTNRLPDRKYAHRRNRRIRFCRRSRRSSR
jgi:hypothetical protein